MVADRKIVQSLINICADAAIAARASVETLKAARTAFLELDPDVTGTALEGNLSTVSAAINSLDTELNKAIWTALIAARVPSHRGRALE